MKTWKVTGLWLDDCRPAPNFTWRHVRNPYDVLPILKTYNMQIMSLDHDLSSFHGDSEVTGYDVLNWIEKALLKGDLTVDRLPEHIYIHSSNPVGRKRMQLAIDSIERIRSDLLQRM